MDTYEASLVVDWYLNLEAQVTSLLHTIDYGPDTRSVFLRPLPSVVLDAGGLLDAVFRDAYQGAVDRGKVTMKHYAAEFETRLSLSGRRSIMYRTPPGYIQPFASWQVDKDDNNGGRLAWWAAYNRIKHDRIEAYREATLENSINIVCALHQLIALVPSFRTALLTNGLFDFGSWGENYALNAAYAPANSRVTILVETKLFATPVGAASFPANIGDLGRSAFWNSRKLWRYVASL